MKCILLFSLLMSVSSFAGQNMHQDVEISNLGSLHSFMLEKSNYNLNHFISAIKQYKPEIILTETRKDFPGPLDGSIDGGIEQSIVYAVAEEINAKVIAVDSWDEIFFQNWKNESDLMQANQDFMDLFMPIYKKRENQIEEFSLLELNSAEQSTVRKQYQLFHDYGYSISDSRNAKICRNIEEALLKTNKTRVLTVFGLDHKYYLDDCVAEMGHQLLSVKSWYSEQILRTTSDTKNNIIKYITSSKELLVNRLSEGYYSSTMADHLSKKLSTFDKWIITSKNSIKVK